MLEWVLRRVNGDESAASKTAIGYVPAPGALKLDGLAEPIDINELFALPKDFWLQEVRYFISKFSLYTFVIISNVQQIARYEDNNN